MAEKSQTKAAAAMSEGYYTLSALPEGTYTVTFSGSTTVDRTATLVVSADKADSNGLITVSAVPICICDYVKNGEIDAYDYSTFVTSFNGDYNIYCDLIKNGEIDAYDMSQFLVFLNKTVEYAKIAL